MEIVAQEMITDLPSSFEENSMIKVVGFDMSKEAARKCYEKSGLRPSDIDVIELHDCFSSNELLLMKHWDSVQKVKVENWLMMEIILMEESGS